MCTWSSIHEYIVTNLNAAVDTLDSIFNPVLMELYEYISRIISIYGYVLNEQYSQPNINEYVI